MRAESRRIGGIRLRAYRLEAEYLQARLHGQAVRPDLTHGLKARCRAIELYLEQDAELAVRSVACLARKSALGEEGGPDAGTVFEALGIIQADRVRLDARLQAELQAFVTTRRLLRIRLSQ